MYEKVYVYLVIIVWFIITLIVMKLILDLQDIKDLQKECEVITETYEKMVLNDMRLESSLGG